jgi:hypothetical protein
LTYDRTVEFAERARQAGRPMRYSSIGQGLGWRVLALHGQKLVEHSGSDVGFRADVLLWPADMSGVVVMVNDETGDPGELSQMIYSILLARNRPPGDRDHTSRSRPE